MHKIINDPVHGFISIRHDLLLKLIDHPFFQRLRHILQLGLTNYVYPGANHSRFHHALGAMHLMMQALDVLKDKKIQISDEEYEAACVAILLHDIGHGPFSHTLEKNILNGIHHEQISLYLMYQLNDSFEGKLSLAIQMFQNQYDRTFFHQLISSQLDVDRLDYLSRDSYFTGVKEGKVNVDRILKMLNVVDNQLVIEEKGVLSIESFLIARKIMYWQVYLHKAVYGAEMLLVKLFERIDALRKEKKYIQVGNSLDYFLKSSESHQLNDEIIHHFMQLNDNAVWHLVYKLQDHEDIVLRNYSRALIRRNLLKSIKKTSNTFDEEIKANTLDRSIKSYFVFVEKIRFKTYSKKQEIFILPKIGQPMPLSQYSKHNHLELNLKKQQFFYFFYPKLDFIIE
jgi:HD superfamily phosphohydrolase